MMKHMKKTVDNLRAEKETKNGIDGRNDGGAEKDVVEGRQTNAGEELSDIRKEANKKQDLTPCDPEMVYDTLYDSPQSFFDKNIATEFVQCALEAYDKVEGDGIVETFCDEFYYWDKENFQH